MFLKRIIKRYLLKKRGIYCDDKSDINYNVNIVDNENPSTIVDSHLHLNKIGGGCFFEHVYTYGDIECGKNVSISGPGTVLHSEQGKISIGSFCSIAPNVNIVNFDHDIKKITTYAVQHNIFNDNFERDVATKGDIIIGEDVWIGANVVITTGVTIGRGAVIAAGAVVNTDVEPYSIYGGVPAKKIKMRFLEEEIKYVESLQWWTWNTKKIRNNKDIFTSKVFEQIRS